MGAVAQTAPPLSAGVDAADSFEALYRRTFPRVYAYVASLLRDRTLVRALAVIAPLALVALLGRAVRRRRRESALA